MQRQLYYKNLKNILENFKNKNIFNIEIELLISLEMPYYMGENFFKICKSILEELLNSKNKFNPFSQNFKIEKFKIILGNSLNRHNWLYRYYIKYLQEKKFGKEEIPLSIKNKLEIKSLKKSRKQGKKWINKNIEAINTLLPKNFKITKDFKIDKERIPLFKGNKNIPKIELISYDYYLNHPEYDKTKKALEEICKLKNNIIERSLQYEVDYFIERIKKRNEKIENEELLRKQSYKYLFDEVVSFIIKHRDNNNIIELYFGGGEPKPTLTFRGRKAQNDPIIKKLMQKGQPLEGADQRKFVSVKLVEE